MARDVDFWDGPGDAGQRGGSPRDGDPGLPQGNLATVKVDGKSPSNRRDLPPSGGVSNVQGLGIDRLSVSFRVDDYDPNPEHWNSYSVRHTPKVYDEWASYEQSHPRDGTFQGNAVESYGRNVEFANEVTAFVGVLAFSSDGRSKGAFGKIEFNPARFVDAAGFGLADVDETLRAFGLIVGGVDHLVVPVSGEDLTSYRIKRIDVAKDFRFVSSPSALLRGLAAIPRLHARKNFIHADPTRGGAQTLTVGSKSGLVRLYDKFAETKGRVEPGTMRWEVEAREAWAKRIGGLRTIADLNLDNITQLASERWVWSSMGAEIVAHLDVKAVASKLGIKESEASTFCGWVVDHGISSGWEPSPTTGAKYRRYLRVLGIGFGLEAFLSNASSIRLDWDSATAVMNDLGATS